MRPFFATPLFRLLTVIVNCSLLFTSIGFAFSPANSSFQSVGQLDSTNPLTLRMRSAQADSLKKLGFSLGGENDIDKKRGPNLQEREQNPNFQETDIQKKEDINNDNQLKDEKNGLKPKPNPTALPISTDTTSALENNSKKKPIHKKSFSAVKNLPDAEKLRTTSERIPKIPEPIPSTACLISTTNCPSNKNQEVTEDTNPTNSAKSDKLLSGFLELKSKNGFSFENLLAFNKADQTIAINSSSVKSKQTYSTSDVSTTLGFFKDTKIYDPTSVNSYSATGSSSALLLPPGGNGKIFDFDGDNKADIGVWRPDTGAWYILRSSDAVVTVQANFGLGSSGHRIVPANYDGDSKTDYAYWQPSTGVWTINQSSNNQNVTYTLGQSGDIPVQGDYDGDGKSDAAVYRPSNGTWYYRKSSDGTTVSQAWGNSTDVPVIGDFDGDNKTDFAVVRPSDSNWWILQSSSGSGVIQWGSVGDRLVPGDYDGDGKTDVGVWRASDNTWYVRKSSNGTLQTYNWGLVADYPVPADYDGDGKTDYAIWRSSSGGWWVVKSTDGTTYSVNMGLSSDIPLPSSYVRYFSASNQPPTAEAGGPYTAALNTAVQFDGRASTDSDGQIYGYNWNFGDGATGIGSRPSHIYSSTGTFTISLTVTDNQGAISSADTTTVTVIDPTNARLDPFNAVGGDDVISRNFSWGTGMAGLPGRAGMGAGISLSYNSLVWLKQTVGANNYLIFDPDNGFPGPGFRLGMPVIEKRHYNSQTGKYGYLMVTESGSRVEFRQVGSSNIYETADSSYTQLLDYGSSLLIRTTDGTQHSYQLIGNEFQCVQIKDRNGNFITATYNNFNRLSEITDTLGRVLAVNYDENGNPISVAQNHSGGQRVYATLGYELKTINTNFSGMTVIGPANNSQITVLKQVAFDDGSYYLFNYNSYGQVYQIDSYAADNHKLNHVKYNLESPGNQTDCPRYTEREDYAENWMTVTTQIVAPVAASWTMPDTNQSVSGLMSKITTPDGTEQRIYYHNSGWDKAIPILNETWGATNPGDSIIRQRWVSTHITQDYTSVSYLQNPRVTESAVGDLGSVHKSSISYTTLSLPSGTVMSLPNDVFEFNSDRTTIYRHTQTDYNFDTEYINRYIIGLTSETRLYAGSGTDSLQARGSFGYDEYTENSLTNLPNIIRHDTTSYGAGFGWRGNRTSVKRWNVVNTAESTVNKFGYTIAGTPSWAQDPVQNSSSRTNISYNDNFSDGVNRNTYAYPTLVTDPGGYTATSKIHYLSGLVDETQGPKPGQTNNSVRGPINKTFYDSIDRVQKTEVLYSNGTPTGAYMRYEYQMSMTAVETYTKLDSSLAEAYSLAVLDGLGQTRARASELPNSNGGFSGRTFLYDNMGRNWKSSLPAETAASGDPNGWSTTGDDNAWLYTTETFDWKGRVLKLFNTDGTFKEKQYDGCGCAGGEVITVKDEATRTQKTYKDLFGRVKKAEILSKNWNGTQYVDVLSSTTINQYNTRDQVINSKVYSGASTTDDTCPTGTCQDSTLEYDGYGRIWKTHLPEQRDSNNNLKYTTRTYNPDDTASTVTDGRGVIQTFAYTYRKQIQQMTFSPVSGIHSVGPYYYQFDAVGNKTQTNDEFGQTSFNYDELSRLQSESRTFDELSRTYTRNYTYNAAGMLTGINDPGNSTLNIGYSYDNIGRNLTVDSGGYGNVQSFITNIKYRAWGAGKELNYGNTLTSYVNYNSRLQVSDYQLKNTGNQTLLGTSYSYTSTLSPANDGLVKLATDSQNTKLNRSYSYDHLGKLMASSAGNSLPQTNGGTDGPYQQSYSYNVFGNSTGGSQRTWSTQCGPYTCPTNASWQSYSETWVNNRNTVTGWAYDNDGRLIQSQNPNNNQLTSYGYDLFGSLRSYTTTGITRWQDFDGDGRKIKSIENGQVSYYVYSSLVGKVIDLDANGNLQSAYVRNTDGAQIARQNGNQVKWTYSNPGGLSNREADNNGSITSQVELDPLGAQVSDSNLFNYVSNGGTYSWNPIGYYGQSGVAQWGTCASSYGPMPCSIVNALNLQPQSIQDWLSAHPQGLNAMFVEMGENMLRRINRGEYDEELPGHPNLGGGSPISTMRDFARRMAQNIINSSLSDIYRAAGYIWLGDFKTTSRENSTIERWLYKFGDKWGRAPYQGKNVTISWNDLWIALDACINEKWKGLVKLKSFLRTQNNKDGETKISYLDGNITVQNATITNNVKSTQFEIGNTVAAFSSGTWNNPNAGGIIGVAFPFSTRVIDGKTYNFNPYTNYTASDADKVAFQNGFAPKFASGVGIYVAIQIHELGNSIAFITGIDITDPNNPDPSGDPDNGIILNRCVADKLTGGR